MTGLGCRSLLCLAIMMFPGAGPARSEDVETGKAAAMLFASNCAMCHGSPRRVPKRTNGWPLTDFLRKHYTASETSAHRLAAYLLAVGGNSRRGKQQPIANVAQQGTSGGSILPPRQPPRQRHRQFHEHQYARRRSAASGVQSGHAGPSDPAPREPEKSPERSNRVCGIGVLRDDRVPQTSVERFQHTGRLASSSHENRVSVPGDPRNTRCDHGCRHRKDETLGGSDRAPASRRINRPPRAAGSGRTAMMADPSGSMCPGTFASVDVAFHCLRRMRQDRPRLGHAEQQGFVVGIARIPRQAPALQGAASKALGTHPHFLRTAKASRGFAAELCRDFGKLRVFRNDQPGRGRAAIPRRCAAEFKTFRPMIVRCQALTPGNASKHLHSAQPRT